MLKVTGNVVQGYQFVDDKTKVYLYAVLEGQPQGTGVWKDGQFDKSLQTAEGTDAAVVWELGNQAKAYTLRYGISFIDEAQAKKNLEREIASASLDRWPKRFARSGTRRWERFRYREEQTMRNGCSIPRCTVVTSVPSA